MSASAERRGISRGALIIGALCLAALFALLLVAVQRSDRPDRQALPSALIGRPAPATVLPLLHAPGSTLDLATLRGRPYVLNVWGSWCPECRVEHPTVSALARSGQVRVIGYALKDDPADSLRWLRQFGNPYEAVVSDVEGKASLNWGIYGAPETFLVDAGGIVRWKHVGPLDQAIVETELLPALAAAERAR
ncbi:DsbE family thiol:disulfide interchange protein [Pseudoxanthomonas winnipegensis]|jgi:cytochrome c biogenesis protein CcmG/thiol:disulfide interchange protein DsbE|uniref:DsbE family thiol:disulfide interchange protein n=1 Tax=Pseudoxanthomonas winnipegensis TaxID=2480810 RepID=A0ABY1W9S7_9GAMM|nr:DsbE family thiol:disulfide interchange protein [Pseudoxanthomonas winnipegensis]TAA08587.1 DsbE family thiol:disulfide interchange protein [Pseudoxanthomonas winnipegensis]TAA16955.1 DsbE family thiol:disulfide interchange protein [Pseudoxanthomonas winnipegensis]TAH72057.1 DsbE family thiol:disulfide interchange protein [Pseudoxanthomonas winnipegensis]